MSERNFMLNIRKKIEIEALQIIQDYKKSQKVKKSTFFGMGITIKKGSRKCLCVILPKGKSLQGEIYVNNEKKLVRVCRKCFQIKGFSVNPLELLSKSS